MIRFNVTRGKKYLEILKYDNDRELTLLTKALRKQNEDYFFNWEYKCGMWDGYDKFIESGRYIPIGLWAEVYKFCEKEGIGCKIEGLTDVTGFKVDEAEFKEFAKNLLKGTE